MLYLKIKDIENNLHHYYKTRNKLQWKSVWTYWMLENISVSLFFLEWPGMINLDRRCERSMNCTREQITARIALASLTLVTDKLFLLGKLSTLAVIGIDEEAMCRIRFMICLLSVNRARNKLWKSCQLHNKQNILNFKLDCPFDVLIY